MEISSYPQIIRFLLSDELKTFISENNILVILAPREELSFYKKLKVNFPFNLLIFPPLNIIPLTNSLPTMDITKERMETIKRLQTLENSVIISCQEAVLLKSIRKSLVTDEEIIRVGEEKDLTTTLEIISQMGYERVSKVEDYGTFSLKGSVLDIFPPNVENPVRITWEFDEIKSIRFFDPSSQISVSTVDKITIIPPIENNVSKIFSKESISLLELLETIGKKTYVFCYPSRVVYTEYLSFTEELARLQFSSKNELSLALEDIILLKSEDFFRELSVKFSDYFPIFSSDEFSAPNYSFLMNHIYKLLETKNGYFFSPNSFYTKRAKEIFDKYGINSTSIGLEEFESNRKKDGIWILENTSLPRGIETSNYFILTVKELFNKEYSEYKVTKVDISSDELKDIFLFENIKEGDYVVHANYGIGIFRGIRELKFLDTYKEFAVVEYQNKELLYVPPEQFNFLTKYIGSDQPKIDSIHKSNWKSIKLKVQKSLLKFSRDIIRLQSLRKLKKKTPLRVDFEEFKLFEYSFPFEETPDQRRALEEIKKDLTSENVMDRILCGDVGFGKTEVIMRVSYLYVLNGKQVAVLVPTTVLAEQHYKTFSERFRHFGVKIGVISRLRKDKEIEENIQKLSSGEIDILIGTHGIVNEQIISKFRDLGLIVIDEEHKFGVVHKEEILKGIENIDTIYLSATPIPRTLGSALGNFRSISLITTPPVTRKDIKTFIVEWNDELVKNAILQEIKRNGQVLVVNNNIKDIEKLKSKILSLGILKEEEICILHGQMAPNVIEKTFSDFMDSKFKLMISTTLSESGLDIPHVNTVIINNAHLFGLADLHQIRGRVGRRGVEGYAYFIYPSRYIINEVQMKRLHAIEEHSDLGAGFRIAMKDLEIRGAGNILGREQHGNIKTVGYVFYARMLSETMRIISENTEISNIDYYSDPVVYLSYGKVFSEISDIPQEEKMEILLKINLVFTENQVNYILKEIEDRYGKVPEGIYKLLEIVKLRIYLKNYKLEQLYETADKIVITFSKDFLPSPERVLEIISSNKFDISIDPKSQNQIFINTYPKDLEDKIKFLRDFLNELFGF